MSIFLYIRGRLLRNTCARNNSSDLGAAAPFQNTTGDSVDKEMFAPAPFDMQLPGNDSGRQKMNALVLELPIPSEHCWKIILERAMAPRELKMFINVKNSYTKLFFFYKNTR